MIAITDPECPTAPPRADVAEIGRPLAGDHGLLAISALECASQDPSVLAHACAAVRSALPSALNGGISQGPRPHAVLLVPTSAGSPWCQVLEAVGASTAEHPVVVVALAPVQADEVPAARARAQDLLKVAAAVTHGPRVHTPESLEFCRMVADLSPARREALVGDVLDALRAVPAPERGDQLRALWAAYDLGADLTHALMALGRSGPAGAARRGTGGRGPMLDRVGLGLALHVIDVTPGVLDEGIGEACETGPGAQHSG